MILYSAIPQQNVRETERQKRDERKQQNYFIKLKQKQKQSQNISLISGQFNVNLL